MTMEDPYTLFTAQNPYVKKELCRKISTPVACALKKGSQPCPRPKSFF